MSEQTELFEAALAAEPAGPDDLFGYDIYVAAFSGGKDSTACVLHLLEEGIPPGKIELWHHDVDGREGEGLMDWPCTPAYCRAFADAFDMDLYFSWKQGGFEREMLRENQRTAPICFETPGGEVRRAGGTNGKRSTRRMFPQVSADLSVRWCSAYLKIDVAAAALRNQERFRGRRTLFVTGERAEESAARKRYDTFGPHKADLRDGQRYRRHIDHWRPVHAWSEDDVWEITERWKVNPHPAYHLGFGRVSCMTCIFGSANQFATVGAIAPERFERVAQYEQEFGTTMKRDMALSQLAARGTPYKEARGRQVHIALSECYDEPIIVEDWQIPAGAYGESCGPI